MRPTLFLGAALLTGCATQSPSTTPVPARIHGIEQAGAADSVRNSFTPADVEFMTGMIGHHAQAIEMSRLAPTNGASGQIQILAGRIINAQQDEIAKMQLWLRDRGQPVPEVGGAHGHHHAMMPGMLTEAQMAELRAARGNEFDKTFLRLMIQHHEGAIQMVDRLFAADGAGQEDVIFKLASDVNVDQITEVDRMRRLLFEITINAAGP
jgi:uncharacterized protein (DUF305 family)